MNRKSSGTAPDPVGHFSPPELIGASKSLVKILNWAQNPEVPISKAVTELRGIFDTISTDPTLRQNFFDNLCFMLQVSLVNGSWKERPNKFDEKIFEVVCRFSASYVQDTVEEDKADEYEVPWLMNNLLIWLLDRHEVASSCARLRICMLVNWLLKNLGDTFEIDEDMYQKIFHNMFERLKDKVAEIRAQAVTALFRLQDPKEDDCPIIKAFLFHLGCDPSSLVRKTIIKNLAASRYTFRYVIKRTKDIDEGVRVAAYKFLAEKVHIKSVSISNREEILKRGLNDRSKRVKEVVSKDLIEAWLQQLGDKIVKFLYALDVGCSDGKTAEDCLKAIFSGMPLKQVIDNFQIVDENKLVPIGDLTPESVVYWKDLVLFLRSQAENGIEEAETHLEKILPELSVFCDYMQTFFENFTKTVDREPSKSEEEEVAALFIGKKLIEIAGLYDYSDESGRRKLLRLIIGLLSSRLISSSFVGPLMKIYHLIQTKAEAKVQEIAEVIADLRDPLTTNTQGKLFQSQQVELTNSQKPVDAIVNAKEDEKLRQMRVDLAKLRLQVNEVTEELNVAVNNMDYIRAQELKILLTDVTDKQKQLHHEIQAATSAAAIVPEEPEPSVGPSQTQSRHDDPSVTLKCLEILSELLKTNHVAKMTPTLQTLMDEFVVPSVASVIHQIRSAAVKTISCLCMRDVKAVRKNILLILQMSHLDEVDVRLQAIKSVVDLLMFHGSAPYVTDDVHDMSDHQESEDGENDDDDDDKKGLLTQADLRSGGVNSVVSALCQLLEDPDAEIRTLVVEGLCKLLIRGQITSPKLFSRFVIIWYNPVTERNGKLNHILGAFLQLYPSLSGDNQQTVLESFMVTMRTLIDAPPHSPLCRINLETVGMFYLDLTRPDYLQGPNNESDVNIHDSLAFTLLNECISDPDCFYIKCFTKFLLHLQLSTTDYKMLRELQVLNCQLKSSVGDKLTLKVLEKFEARIEELLKTEPVTEREVIGNTTLAATNAIATNGEIEISTPSTPSNRKRTLFNQNQNRMLLQDESPEMERQSGVMTSTQQPDDDEAFTIDTTTTASQSTKSDLPSINSSPAVGNTRCPFDSEKNLVSESSSENVFSISGVQYLSSSSATQTSDSQSQSLRRSNRNQTSTPIVGAKVKNRSNSTTSLSQSQTQVVKPRGQKVTPSDSVDKDGSDFEVNRKTRGGITRTARKLLNSSSASSVDSTTTTTTRRSSKSKTLVTGMPSPLKRRRKEKQ